MKRIPLFILMLFTVFLSFHCGDKDKRPSGVLAAEKMENVLWDMMRAGEYLNTHVLYTDTSIDKVAESKLWYDKIFTIHGITKTDFDKSFKWYKQNPGKMAVLMDSISKRKPYEYLSKEIPAVSPDTVPQQLVPADTSRPAKLPSSPARRILRETLPVE
ncbi:MAG TPA: DUF4296 domain-containing protein [Chitinophagaceae bacterium]|nr:DUF4296 domain-containing protein [Chitinophagaceae bacterium]